MTSWTVLISLALACLANAQASAGGDQSVCSPAQTFQYRGCFGDAANGNHAGLGYPIEPYSDNTKYYPGFSREQLTIEMCLEACRGHGFRYAALYSRDSCWCGTIEPKFQSSASNPSNNATLNECHIAPVAEQGCRGSRTEWCGSGFASDVYGDPSFPNVILSQQNRNYQPLGCFYTQNPGNFWNGGPPGTPVANTAACWALCASGGFPYAGMSDAQTCACGTAFEVGRQAQSESDCAFRCTPGESVEPP